MMTRNTSASSSEYELRFPAVWSSIGIPPRLAHATLDNYKPTCPEQERALQKCRIFVRNALNNIAQGRGLLFQGSVGTGKSHMSAATLRAMIENNLGQFGRPASELLLVDEPIYQGYYCSMVSVVDLLGLLRQSYSADRLRAPVRRLLHRCRTDAVVILDDIGAEKPSDWVEEQLYSIIDMRYRMLRSTIFTTNRSMKQLENQIGSRSVSRIMEMCQGVRVGGEDWRKVRGDTSLTLNQI